ncbi:unnamed protein product [Closterium sp. NIES-65]|nr:unnamed protein product [Closterium sp. NIES-65]
MKLEPPRGRLDSPQPPQPRRWPQEEQSEQQQQQALPQKSRQEQKQREHHLERAAYDGQRPRHHRSQQGEQQQRQPQPQHLDMRAPRDGLRQSPRQQQSQPSQHSQAHRPPLRERLRELTQQIREAAREGQRAEGGRRRRRAEERVDALMAEYHALGGAPATWMYAARIQLCLVKGATWRRLGRGRFQLAEAEPGRTRLGGGATGEREGEVRVGEGEGEAEGRQRVALRQLARARELWQEMRAHGLQADKYAASAMIAVCGRAGRADEAERVMAGVALGGRRVVGEAVLGGRRVVGEAVLGGRRVVGEAMLGGTWEGEAVLEGTGVGGQVEPGKVSSGAGVADDARSRDAGMGGFNSGLNGGWKSGFNDVVVWNALADAWSRSGDAERSEGVLSRMLHAHCPPNLRSYNIVLNAYAKSITPVSAHGDDHTSEHVNEGRGEMRVIRHNDRREEQWADGLMRGHGWLTHGGRHGSSPSVPPRLSPSETIHRMRQLIASMSRQELPPWPSNAARCTSRQDLAARVTRSSKSTLDAVTPCTTTSATVTPDAVTPDIVTFNTLLDACARAADVDAAVDTWQQMIGSGITPTELYTFSCNHLFPLSLPPSALSLPNRPMYRIPSFPHSPAGLHLFTHSRLPPRPFPAF